MSERPLRTAIAIDTIELVRAPGLPRSFRLTGFQPGVNIIWGPNGSGKSTTARAIHSLFWPEQTDDGVHLDTSISYDGASWSLRREGKRVSAQRAGHEHAAITFAHLTPETRDRYLLALHDLLQKTDAAFAGQIAREMSGGYDIQAAAKETGFEKGVSAHKARTHLDAARSEYNRLIADQKRIAADQDELKRLEEDSNAVDAARVRRGRLENIRTFLSLQAHADEAAIHFNQYDRVMEHARASDPETIAGWEREEPILQDKRTSNTQIREELAARREALRLADIASVQNEIALLTERLAHLHASDARRSTTHRALAAARVLATRLSNEIGPVIPPDMRLDQTVKLLKLFAAGLNQKTSADQIGAAEAILAARVPRPQEPPALYPLENRLVLLGKWLHTPPHAESSAVPASIRWLVVVAAVVILAEAALLGYYWNGYAYSLTVIGIAVLGLGLMLGGRQAIDEPRTRIAAEYLTHGYRAPAEWNASAVAIEIGAAIEDLQRARDIERVHQIWLALEPKLHERQVLQGQAASALAELETRLGTRPTLDSSALQVLASSLDALLKASTEVARLEAQHAQEQEEYEADLRLFQEAVRSGTEHTAMDVATASALLANLKARSSELINLNGQIQEIDARLENSILPDLLRIERARKDMIERYGGRSIGEIARLANDCSAWAEAQTRMKNRQDQLDFARKGLGDDFIAEEWPIERVEEDIAACLRIEQQAADTNQRIGSINNEISSAMRSDQVAKAIDALKKAERAMVEKRDEHIKNAVGRLILADVRAETRDTNLPQVARRARELFVAFTKGRYELRMSQGNVPAFTAWDHQLGTEQAIHELSSATRVQLLMAVRMAFVEQQESDVQLPMIFDETLANADDVRADALIDATLEIAANGRQVFYFTAQHDEVEKWRERAHDIGSNISVIDLAEARELAERKRPPSFVLTPLVKLRVPEPGGQTRTEYRRTLAVPHLDLWNDDIGAAHLWYLIDDLPRLHRLITNHHVTIWGQVRQYAIGATAPALGIDQATYARLSACADALHHLCAMTRIGRGKPVSETELKASGGMTPAFEKACLDLLRQVNGDGKLFVNHLDNKKISGIQKAKVSNFRVYFEEHGHIVEDEPLTTDIIRARLARNCDSAISRGDIDLNTIDRLLAEAFPAQDSIPDLAKTASRQIALLPSGE